MTVLDDQVAGRRNDDHDEEHEAQAGATARPVDQMIAMNPKLSTFHMSDEEYILNHYHYSPAPALTKNTEHPRTPKTCLSAGF
jgi:hypothetical protein